VKGRWRKSGNQVGALGLESEFADWPENFEDLQVSRLGDWVV